MQVEKKGTKKHSRKKKPSVQDFIGQNILKVLLANMESYGALIST